MCFRCVSYIGHYLYRFDVACLRSCGCCQIDLSILVAILLNLNGFLSLYIEKLSSCQHHVNDIVSIIIIVHELP